MKIVKTTEKEAVRSLVRCEKNEDKTSGNEGKQLFLKLAAFFMENKKRAVVVACSITLICAAIGLNWLLLGDDITENLPAGNQTELPSTNNPVANPTADIDTYFALAVIERQRARDEALEVLQSVVDSVDANQEEKDNALSAMNEIANDIKLESNIQTLILSAGFKECIAVIENGTASIVVESDTPLAVNQIAQITGIVYTQSGIEPTNITIREKKAGA